LTQNLLVSDGDRAQAACQRRGPGAVRAERLGDKPQCRSTSTSECQGRPGGPIRRWLGSTRCGTTAARSGRA